VVLIPLAIFATRWYGKKQGGGGELRVKEVLSLGANRALYVVVWEDKQLLIGVTNQQITVLGEKQLVEPKEVPE
jgi:flagellar biogenesis protein FliO